MNNAKGAEKGKRAAQLRLKVQGGGKRKETRGGKREGFEKRQ